MIPPNPDDTIVAVSSGWAPAVIGIVRISGPRAIEACRHVSLGIEEAGGAAPRSLTARLRLGESYSIPATVLVFPGPRSFTGDDLVEIHTLGSLPLLRSICDRLIAAGVRPAGPGEFTARAYLHGRLAADEVAGVLGLLRAEDEAGARRAARRVRGAATTALQSLQSRIEDLMARIEAGIDFVDEEDIRFVSQAEALATIDAILADLATLDRETARNRRSDRFHVVLAGPPNAGKSTLFNALCGQQRAIVSPILGTTRDVLEVELELGHHRVVLQDTAGVDPSGDPLTRMTAELTDATAHGADLVLWVEPADAAPSSGARGLLARLDPQRVLRIRSKVDLAASEPFDADQIAISATDGVGLTRLKESVQRAVAELGLRNQMGTAGRNADVGPPLRRARELIRTNLDRDGDLVALELRSAWSRIAASNSDSLDEAVLDRIYCQFCVGK